MFSKKLIRQKAEIADIIEEWQYILRKIEVDRTSTSISIVDGWLQRAMNLLFEYIDNLQKEIEKTTSTLQDKEQHIASLKEEVADAKAKILA